MQRADAERARAAGRFRLDFSALRREGVALLGAGSEEAREAEHARFRAEIEARAGKLARVAPNLKALDQFAAVKVRGLPCPCVTC